ncbi:hypothetical protein ACROYT_G021700 [Oculina patagonica]
MVQRMQYVVDTSRHKGRDPLDQIFRKFRYKIKWNRKFPETRFENFGQLLEVVLKFRKIGILGKSCSIRQFMLGPSFSQPGNRQNSTWRSFQLLDTDQCSSCLLAADSL